MKTTYILLALGAQAAARGQQQPSRAAAVADSSPAQIFAALGTEQWGLIPIANIIRGRHGAQPTAKSNELADSLMRRAISAPPGRHADLCTLGAASALAHAGALADGGTPYAGSMDRLIRIHRQGRHQVVRARALSLLPGVVGWQGGMQYLHDVAASTDSTARDAAHTLIITTLGGSQGGPMPSAAQRQTAKRLLWDLLDRKLVRNQHAELLVVAWSNSPEGGR